MPAIGAYSPASQSVQESPGDAECLPAGHKLHLLEELALNSAPAGQGSHSDDPATRVVFPSLQDVQDASPLAE
jgi:hypothetical protein